MPTIDEQIAEKEAELEALRRQREAARGRYNKFKVIRRSDGEVLNSGRVLVLVPPKKGADLIAAKAYADALERANEKPKLVADLRDWFDKIEG